MPPALLHLLRRDLADLLDLVLPRSCGGCGAQGFSWCAQCRAGVLEQCWPGGARLVAPDPCPDGMPPAWAAAAFGGAVRRLLTAYKDHDRPDLRPEVVGLLAAAARAAWRANPRIAHGMRVVVVPVPSGAASTRRRGRSPLRDSARALAPLLPGRPPVVPALRFGRRVRDQARLGAVERASNLRGAMTVAARWAPALQGALCLLVDDVVTTGATTVEAARALRAAGASEVVVVAAAVSLRRGRLRQSDTRASVGASDPLLLGGGAGSLGPTAALRHLTGPIISEEIPWTSSSPDVTTTFPSVSVSTSKTSSPKSRCLRPRLVASMSS